jgi:hypothetical protein
MVQDYVACFDCGKPKPVDAWCDSPECQPIVEAAQARIQARVKAQLITTDPEPAEQPKGAPMTGTELIAAERRRQVEVEGWTSGHDAEHGTAELVDAAACYLMAPRLPVPIRHAVVISHGPDAGQPWTPERWPWEPRAWKPVPNDRVRELVKAGALIAAEIDRLTAAAQPVEPIKCDHGFIGPHRVGIPAHQSPWCPGPVRDNG